MDKASIVVVFSEDKQDREYISETLSSIFDNSLQFIPLGTADLPSAKIKDPPKAVVITESARTSAPFYFPESNIIFANRIISGQNIEKIIMLPTNTTALVANSPLEAAIETASSLNSLGIHHLNLIPYCSGSDIDTTLYDTVIYTGLKSHCPPNKNTYIDIGHRHLTLATLVEIIKTYDLSYNYINQVHARYTSLFINNCYAMDSILRETRSLKETLENVCNLSDNAIISINNNGLIYLVNPIAELYLGIKLVDVKGKDYQRGLEKYPSLIELISQKEVVKDILVYLGEKAALVTTNIITIEGHLQMLLYLTPAELLQRSEYKIRTKLHKRGFSAKYNFEDIIGESNIIKKTISIARQYAKSDATILITGESGTGKELFAQAIHNSSARVDAPFVGINFAALPESIAESELFGYEEGAFTGAVKGGKLGLFEIAHNGTIFLDEIGDASLSMQIKLLRVIEEREIIRIGSAQVIPINIRIICATNKDLLEMVKSGKFREDLFYRLRVLPLHIPSLRERKSDIPSIINSLSKQFSSTSRQPDYLLTEFLKYDWPGNIRELKTIVQYFSVLTNDDQDILSPITIDEVLQYFFHDRTAVNNSDDYSIPFLGNDLIAILNEIYISNTNNVSVGRYSLSKSAKLRDINLTETKIKVRLKKLENLGLIITGKTRQGVTLTSKGLDIIKNHESNM
ncbi:MAG: sigma 54-interacting transcriptional regulator [Clostridiaceae bacterium]|nr:sigma 54-interacting transcriptional regulator [Clostridiaceae bacterium]